VPLLERRTLTTEINFRAAAEGSRSPGTLIGYAAVFNKYSVDLGEWRELIMPGAFRDCLGRDDVRALVNHDENQLLGRSRSGTMMLEEDPMGLMMSVELPDTTAGRDVAEMVRRGDLSGCSFSFTTEDAEWDFTGPVAIRTLKRVKQLFDVGPVTYPAYDDTGVAVRSFRSARDRIEGDQGRERARVALTLARARLRLEERA
jgi:HK97 family phage prohead protease